MNQLTPEKTDCSEVLFRSNQDTQGFLLILLLCKELPSAHSSLDVSAL